MKIEFFKKHNSFKKKDLAPNPNLYWKIAVFCTFFFIIISAFFGYYLFTQINQEFVLPITNSSGQVPTVNKNRVENALNYFSEREEKSKQIIANPAPVVDPSL